MPNRATHGARYQVPDSCDLTDPLALRLYVGILTLLLRTRTIIITIVPRSRSSPSRSSSSSIVSGSCAWIPSRVSSGPPRGILLYTRIWRPRRCAEAPARPPVLRCVRYGRGSGPDRSRLNAMPNGSHALVCSSLYTTCRLPCYEYLCERRATTKATTNHDRSPLVLPGRLPPDHAHDGCPTPRHADTCL